MNAKQQIYQALAITLEQHSHKVGTIVLAYSFVSTNIVGTPVHTKVSRNNCSHKQCGNSGYRKFCRNNCSCKYLVYRCFYNFCGNNSSPSVCGNNISHELLFSQTLWKLLAFSTYLLGTPITIIGTPVPTNEVETPIHTNLVETPVFTNILGSPVPTNIFKSISMVRFVSTVAWIVSSYTFLERNSSFKMTICCKSCFPIVSRNSHCHNTCENSKFIQWNYKANV